MNVSPDFQLLRDQWALKLPYPSNSSLEYQMRLDKSKNPHNDSYKPALRSEAEIVSDLAYHFADEVLTAQYGTPYKSWLLVMRVEELRAWARR